MDFCLYNDNCLSFIYYRAHYKCKLLSFNQHDYTTLIIYEPLVDYYELACDRTINNTKLLINSTINKNLNNLLTSKIPLKTTAKITTTNIINNNYTITNNENVFTTTIAISNELNEQKINNNSIKMTQIFNLNQLNKTKNFNNKNQNNFNQTNENNLFPIYSQTFIANNQTLTLDYHNLHYTNVLNVKKCELLCCEALKNCKTFAYNNETKDCLLSTTLIQLNNSKFTKQNLNYNLYSFMPNQKNCNLIKIQKIYKSKMNNLKNNVIFESKITLDSITPKIITEKKFLINQKINEQEKVFNKNNSIIENNLTTSINNFNIPKKSDLLKKIEKNNIIVNAICLPNGINITFQLLNNKVYFFNY